VLAPSGLDIVPCPFAFMRRVNACWDLVALENEFHTVDADGAAVPQHLSVSQARPRLMLQGAGRGPAEAENRAPMADLFGDVHPDGNIAGVLHPTGKHAEGIAMADSFQQRKHGRVETGYTADTSAGHLALNELSLSTCASESDLAQPRGDGDTFRLLLGTHQF
jgi:hypothetical protein